MTCIVPLSIDLCVSTGRVHYSGFILNGRLSFVHYLIRVCSSEVLYHSFNKSVQRNRNRMKIIIKIIIIIVIIRMIWNNDSCNSAANGHDTHWTKQREREREREDDEIWGIEWNENETCQTQTLSVNVPDLLQTVKRTSFSNTLFSFYKPKHVGEINDTVRCAMLSPMTL